MKTSLWLLSLFFASSSAIACSCPLDTQTWWDASDDVALVRVNSTGVTSGHPIMDTPCVDDGPCVVKQSASFKTIETFKGSLANISRLTSGYGSGDCGIPLVAGAYYVLFTRGGSGQIGFCNAAGPYAPRYPYARHSAFLDPFLVSLRKAAKAPGQSVMRRPVPMRFDAFGGQ
ncbi:hypothetical protein [Lysobacter brunescens]|uniref:Secreted protein n=1 Tax=Lysobacter brunescens TaxID=262323 RepID=A0ABW2YI53_9GAMM